jgi:hypothetical protein
MRLDYYPIGFDKIDLLFKDIYVDKDKQKKKILDAIDDRFCIFEIMENDKYFICGKKVKNKIVNNCCYQHIKYLHPEIYKNMKKDKINYYVKKDKNDIYYCNSISRRKDKCGSRVKYDGELCYKHKIIEKDKTIILNVEKKVDNEKIFSDSGTIKKHNYKLYNKCMKCNSTLEPSLKERNCNLCFNDIFYNYIDGNKIQDEIKKEENIYDKKDNSRSYVMDTKNKIMDYYEEIKKVKIYIKTNKLFYISKNDKNKRKYFYYNEIDVRNLLEYVNNRYNLLIEDIYDYGKNNCLDFLKEYRCNLDKHIIDFYNSSDNKIFL